MRSSRHADCLPNVLVNRRYRSRRQTFTDRTKAVASGLKPRLGGDENKKGDAMELYIKWAFWLGIAAIVVRSLTMCVSPYPRVTKWSLGEDVVQLLVTAFFAFWAWRLVYA